MIMQNSTSRNIYAIGETVLDIMFRKGEVQAAKPGGSMLNSAVSLGRTGLNISLISETGNDQTGNLIVDFLRQNHVQTHHVCMHKNGKTALAMAFLNERGDASYDFYKYYPSERLPIEIPAFTPADVLLFGSWFGIDPALRSKLYRIVKAAADAGALIIYDPNFRRPHAHQLNQVKSFILENMQLAHIIKASHEDLEIIFGFDSLEALQQVGPAANKPLLLTRASQGVQLLTNDISLAMPAAKVKVVSTIGAGDNFNAGIIYGLIKNEVTPLNLQNLSILQWQSIVSYGLKFATACVQSYDNFVPEDFNP